VNVTERRVRTIDFRRPSKFTREQMRRLEHEHEAFCRSASSRLSAELRTELELSLVGSDQLPYVTAIETAPERVLLVILQLEPLGTQVALLLETRFLLCLVDRLLGGEPLPRSDLPDALTDVEQAIARRALGSLLGALSASWSDMAGARFTLVDLESSATTVHLAPASEPTLLLTAEARLGSLASPLTLCLPYRAIEPILAKLEQAHGAQTRVDPAVTAVVADAVSQVDVELRAEAGAIEMTLADVLALRPGDVVRLRRQAAAGVTLLAGDTPTHVAQPGRNGNARAVQIRSAWSR